MTSPGARDEQQRGAVDSLVSATRACLLGVISYGSLVNAAAPRPDSALDVFVVVDSYRRFWARCPAAGLKAPFGRTVLSSLLPPTTVLLGPHPALVKAGVIQLDQFVRELGPAAKDHFLRGRLSQGVEIAWARDDATAVLLRRLIDEARALTTGWVPAHLQRPFTAAEFVTTLIEVSYRWEPRPEARGRAMEVASAQAETLAGTYGQMLESAVAEGRLAKLGPDQYVVLADVDPANWFFARSWWRAVGRLPRYALMTRGWRPYLIAKVRRRNSAVAAVQP